VIQERVKTVFREGGLHNIGALITWSRRERTERFWCI